MSWKTTIFGLMAAIGAALVAAFASGVLDPAEFPKWVRQAGLLMSVIGTAGMGFCARDNRVTSEQVKENEEKMKNNGTHTLMLMAGSLVLASGLLWLLTGCMNKAVVTTGPDGRSVTNFTKVVDVEHVARLAENGARVGTRAYLLAQPQNRPLLEEAAAALQVLADGKNYDPAAFEAVMTKLPLKTLQGTEGAIYISVGVMVWDEAVQFSEPVMQKELVRAVLPRVLKGMREGLQGGKPGARNFEQEGTEVTEVTEGDGRRFLTAREERELGMLPEVIMPQARVEDSSGVIPYWVFRGRALMPRGHLGEGMGTPLPGPLLGEERE